MNLATLKSGHSYGRMRKMYTVTTFTAPQIDAVQNSCIFDGGAMCRKSSTNGTVKYLHINTSFSLRYLNVSSESRLSIQHCEILMVTNQGSSKKCRASPELDEPCRHESYD